MGEEDSDVEAEEEQGAYCSPSAASLGSTDYSQVDTLGVRCKSVNSRVKTTEGPSWGHSKVVIGAIRSFLEQFGGHLSPKFDKVFEELTLRYPHEEP